MTTRTHIALILAVSLGATAPTIAAADSGFLDDYSDLRPALGNDCALLYLKPGLNLGQYDKLMVDEIAFHYADDSPYKDIRSTETERFSRTASDSLKRAVAGRFAIVEAAGPGVLYLRAALSDIRATKKSKNPLSFTPVGLVKQGVEAAAGWDFVLRGVTAEVELDDALTGEKLIAVMDSRAGFHCTRKSEKASWNDVQRTLDDWTARLVNRVDTVEAGS